MLAKWQMYIHIMYSYYLYSSLFIINTERKCILKRSLSNFPNATCLYTFFGDATYPLKVNGTQIVFSKLLLDINHMYLYVFKINDVFFSSLKIIDISIALMSINIKKNYRVYMYPKLR